MLKKLAVLLLVCLSISACQSAVIGVRPSAGDLNALNTQRNHQASAVFEYREMVAGGDIDIYQVARRFLWAYEPADVNPEPYLKPLPSAYPIRRYEITFYGPNASQVDAALQAWVKLFKEHGGALESLIR